MLTYITEKIKILEIDIIKEYGDTRVENANLKNKVENLKQELAEVKANYVCKQEVKDCFYQSSDGKSLWLEDKSKDKFKELVSWEEN